MKDCNVEAACMGRREFLVKAGLVAGASVLTVSAGGNVFGSSRFEDVTIPVAADSALAKVGGSQIIDSSAGKLIVIHVADKQFAAFSAVCTHKKGILEYNGKELSCPKHGSKFDTANGNVAKGPAEAPVKSYAVKAGDGSVTIAVV